MNLGNILINIGKIEDAELSIRKAIDLNPNDPIAYSNYGSILQRCGELKKAEVFTRKAIEKFKEK